MSVYYTIKTDCVVKLVICKSYHQNTAVSSIVSFSVFFRGTRGRAGMESRVIYFTSITLTRKRKTRKGLHEAVGEDPR